MQTARTNFLAPDEVLRKREWPKYAALDSTLIKKGVPHKFEYRVGRYVFDLLLSGKGLLIEFDGRYHAGSKQQEIDAKKDLVAAQHGFSVLRVEVTSAEAIDPSILDGVV